jgi:hypothetical protein
VKVFSVDDRSLALFRVAIAAVVVVALATHAAVVPEFHVPSGALTPEALREHYATTWCWSLNWLSGSTGYQYALIAVGCLAAAALAIGWRTRVACIACWALVTSFNYDAPPIVGGGDILLNLLLFWGILLPLGRRWSVDATRAAPPDGHEVHSAASAAILIQMAVMYLFSGISKLNPVWLNGSAIDVALHADRLVRPAGFWLREHAWLTRGMTYATLAGELLLPFALLSPWKTSRCRSIAVIALMGLHAGIELTMRVILFSFASVAGLAALVPASWWEWRPLSAVAGMLDGFAARRQRPTAGSQPSRQQTRRLRRTGQVEAASGWQRLVRGATVALIGYVLVYNLLEQFGTPAVRASMGSFQRPGEVLALKQYWNMFSDPRYLLTDVASPGRRRDSTYIDLLRRGESVSGPESRPAHPIQYPLNGRLLALTTVVADPGNRKFLPGILDFWIRHTPGGVEAGGPGEILEAFLMYFPLPGHPAAADTAAIEAFHLDRRARGVYLAGLRHGPWTLYHDNGVKGGAGAYFLGELVGPWKFWNDRGQETAAGMMDRGQRVGVWTYTDGEGKETKVDHSANPPGRN